MNSTNINRNGVQPISLYIHTHWCMCLCMYMYMWHLTFQGLIFLHAIYAYARTYACICVHACIYACMRMHLYLPVGGIFHSSMSQFRISICRFRPLEHWEPHAQTCCSFICVWFVWLHVYRLCVFRLSHTGLLCDYMCVKCLYSCSYPSKEPYIHIRE